MSSTHHVMSEAARARATDDAWSPYALAEREPSRRVDGEFFLTGSLLLG